MEHESGDARHDEHDEKEAQQQQPCDNIVIVQGIGHGVACDTIAPCAHLLMVEGIVREEVLAVILGDIDLL